MKKKDLILIAVLANMGVLAILFMLAVREDEEPAQDVVEASYVIQDIQLEQPQPSSMPASFTAEEPMDEMDDLLRKNSSSDSGNAFTEEEDIPLLDQETPQMNADTSEDNKEEAASAPSHLVEVTVKRGDALEKLARAHGTTVDAIKKANNLKNDKLKIGQVLQIPVGQPKETSGTTKKASVRTNTSSEPYYTIKNGDNPWKIAKQFNMRVDELLKLNDLDEDKARNLKVGDQIRVK
jgi:peptidoglycan DL-endopeptidase LytF